MDAQEIRCPGCDGPMAEAETRGVRLDRCRQCSGLWFDVGELVRAARCQVPPMLAGRASNRRCPHCRAPLRLAAMGPAVVDWCESCLGFYLDQGEFEAIRKGRPPLRTKPVGHRSDADETFDWIFQAD